jgi:ribose transport system substrate-binding protein
VHIASKKQLNTKLIGGSDMEQRGFGRLPRVAALGLLVAVVCLGTTVSGAMGHTSKGAAAKQIMVFGYFPSNFNTGTLEWYSGWMQAAKKLGPGYNVIFKGEGSLDEDPGHFVNFIKTGMVQQPDGVVVVPNNGAGMVAGLKQLQSQYPNTKFLIMDSPAPGFNPTSFVGTNNYDAGVQAGKWLLSQYNAHKLLSNEVAVFKATPGTASQDDRAAGFKAAIKGSPLTIVKTIETADYSQATARANMADVLTGHPNVGSVFSTTDNFGLGVADELVSAHKTNIKQISVDAGQPAVEDIINHAGVDAEIAQAFQRTGYLSVLTLADVLQGKTVPKQINPATTLVTIANAKQFLKQTAEMTKP